MTDMTLSRFAPLRHSPLVYVKRVRGKGRGVFAKQPIRKGTVIERVPVLVFHNTQFVGGLRNRVVQKYFYIWTKNSVALTLGYGSLYNHSYEPNADYHQGRRTMTYRAIRDIAANEEITINYNGDPDDKDSVGFKVVERRKKSAGPRVEPA
jgi:SET domain-containing protein